MHRKGAGVVIGMSTLVGVGQDCFRLNVPHRPSDSLSEGCEMVGCGLVREGKWSKLGLGEEQTRGFEAGETQGRHKLGTSGLTICGQGRKPVMTGVGSVGRCTVRHRK